MRHSLTIICLLLIFPTFKSCSYVSNVRLLTNGELKRTNFLETVPFELRKDLIVIKAFVNSDTLAREFIFDTGAFNSKIEKGLANHLGLETITTKSNSTAAGVTKKIEVTRLDSIKIGTTYFYNIGAGKVAYGKKSASPCIAPHGIVGANLMKLAHWKIDFEKSQLQFSDKPFDPTPNRTAYKLPFEKPTLSGTPLITVVVEGKIIENVLFDVGYNGGLVLPSEFANSFPSTEEEVIFDRSTTGIYGSKTDTLIAKELEVSLGNYTNKIPVMFSGNGKALLGTELLKSCVVLIDYDQKEITLQPFTKINIAPVKKFVPGILNDTFWVVDRTNKDLPLKLGDTLTLVNGFRPKDLFETHCDYVMSVAALVNNDSILVHKLNHKEAIIISGNHD